MFDVLDCDQPTPGWYIVDAGGDLLNGPYPGPGEAWDSADELPWPEIDGIMWIGETQ